MANRESETLQLALRLATETTPVTRAAIRRLWMQGWPAYESLAGRTFKWWSDGRLEPADGEGPVGYVDPKVVLLPRPN